MKTKKKIIVLAVGLSSALNFAFATPNLTNDHRMDTHVLEASSAEPIFDQKGGKVSLNLLNLTKSEVIIRVYDAYGRKLYSEVITDQLTVAKSFDFTGAYVGTYKIELRYNGKKYKEVVEVK